MSQSQEDVFDIGAFLAQQASEGAVESQGEFTVSQEKAAHKLGRLSFPFEYAWVLKIVQAAVAWKSSRIEVRQYRAFTVFAFLPESAESIPTEESLVGTLLSGRIYDQSPLPLFCHGLRGMAEQSGLSFRLLLDKGHSAPRPIHAGRDAGALAEEERLACLGRAPGIRLLVAHLPLGQFFMARYVPKPLLGVRPDLRIVDALERYCFLCPVPLVLDGRRIDRLLGHPQWGFRSGRRPIALSPLKCPELPDLAVPEDFEEKLIAVQTHRRRAQRTYSGNTEGNVWLYLEGTEPSRDAKAQGDTGFSRKGRHHSLLFVQHGVVVECYTALVTTYQVALTVILGADGFSTDLSGLSLIRDDRLEQAISDASKAVGQRLLELSVAPDVLINDEPDEHSAGDELNYRLASESHRKAEELVGKRFPSLKTGVAAVLFAGRWMTKDETDLPPLADALAFEWLQLVLKDLDDLESLATARFEASTWLSGVKPKPRS